MNKHFFLGFLVGSLVAGVSVMALGGVLFLVFLQDKAQVERPPKQSESATELRPDEWSHRELLEHFKRRGLMLETTGTPSGTDHGPAMYFGRTGTEPNHFILDNAAVDSEFFQGCAYVQKRKSAEDARDHAAVLGENAFSWHRFYFAGDAKFLQELRRLLP